MIINPSLHMEVFTNCACIIVMQIASWAEPLDRRTASTKENNCYPAVLQFGLMRPLSRACAQYKLCEYGLEMFTRIKANTV